MSSRPVCPSCGSGNPPTLAVCWKCGAPLSSTTPIQRYPLLPSADPPPTIPVSLPTPTATFQTQPPSTSVPYEPYMHTSTDTLREMAEAKRKKDTSQTKTGLVILIIGYTTLAIIIAASVFNLLFGSLAPVAGLIGIVGGLLIVLSRDTFGRAQSRNAILSALLFILSVVTIVAGRILFGAALLLSRIPNGTITYGNTISSTVNPYLILYITDLIGTALTGLAIVFLTYVLHRKTGRIILSISYITFLTLTILTTALILQGFEIRSSITIDLSKLETMRYQYEIVQLLTIIPTLAFAFTFYLAWSRIKRGEIPEAVAVTTTPRY